MKIWDCSRIFLNFSRIFSCSVFLILNLTTTRLCSSPPSSYSNLKHSVILMLLRNPVSVDSRHFSRSMTRQWRESPEKESIKWAWNFHFSHCLDSSFFLQLILLYYITVSRFSQYHRKWNQNTVLKAWGRFLFVRFPFETWIQNSHDVFFIFLLFFGCTQWYMGPQLPDQGLSPHPIYLKCRVLTSGPPGKFPIFSWYLVWILCQFLWLPLSFRFLLTQTTWDTQRSMWLPMNMGLLACQIKQVNNKFYKVCSFFFFFK